MGSQVKTVSSGGGSATPVAQDFNGFLAQGLNNGSYGAVGQTQGIGSALNGLLGGGAGNPQPNPNAGSIQSTLSNFGATPNFQPGQNGFGIGGYMPNNTNFGGVNFSQGLGGSAPTISLGGYNTPGSVNFGVGSGGGADLSGIVGQIGQRNLMSPINSQFQGAPSQVNSSNSTSPEFDAISKILGNQFTKDLGDIRERYGISSAGLQNEAIYRGQAIPQLQNALTQAALQQRQANQQDISLGLQGQGLNLQNALGQLNAGVTQAGQNLNSLNTGRQLDISSGQLASQQGLQQIQNILAGQGLGVTQRGQDINAGLTSQGQQLAASQSNAQNYLQNRGLDLSQLGQINQMLLGQGQLGLQGQQYGAQNFLGGQGLLNQYMQNYGQLGLGYGQLGLGGQQLAQQGQLGALQSLMGAYQQANQLGTPQAQTQTYSQPSTFQNVMGALSGLTQGLGGFFQGLGSMGVVSPWGTGNNANTYGAPPDASSLANPFINMQTPGVSSMMYNDAGAFLGGGGY